MTQTDTCTYYDSDIYLYISSLRQVPVHITIPTVTCTYRLWLRQIYISHDRTDTCTYQDSDRYLYILYLRQIHVHITTRQIPVYNYYDSDRYLYMSSLRQVAVHITIPTNTCNTSYDSDIYLYILLLITFIQRYSPLSSRLTALACDSTWVNSFYSAFLNIRHRSGVLTALAWLVPQESAARESQSRRVLCTPYSHAPCHFMQSHIRKVYACLAVTCHLRFWQDDRGLLRATAVTRGWNGYRNKSQHRKLTLEKKILPPLQQGFEPATFRSRVRRSNHWAIPAPRGYHNSPRGYHNSDRYMYILMTDKYLYISPLRRDRYLYISPLRQVPVHIMTPTDTCTYYAPDRYLYIVYLRQIPVHSIPPTDTCTYYDPDRYLYISPLRQIPVYNYYDSDRYLYISRLRQIPVHTSYDIDRYLYILWLRQIPVHIIPTDTCTYISQR